MQIGGVVQVVVVWSQLLLVHSRSDPHGWPSAFGAVHVIVVGSQ
jgi:hypothetical protein